MAEWNEYQKKLLEECKNCLVKRKIYCNSFNRDEQKGMAKMMKHLTGKVDITVIWNLTFQKRFHFSGLNDLLSSCLAEIYSEKTESEDVLEISETVNSTFFRSSSPPVYPRISFVLPKEFQDAAEKNDIAKLTFLLDVTDDREWNREQLLAFFVKQKDFGSITALGLYDLVGTLKEYRYFPLFFHVDTNKYPELSTALYQCLNPEKVLKKVISCRMISKYTTFLQNHGMSSDTVLFQSGPVRITLEQYYNFWKEIFPSAILLKGKHSYFDPILADAEQLLSNPQQTDVKKKKGKKKSSIPHKD